LASQANFADPADLILPFFSTLRPYRGDYHTMHGAAVLQDSTLENEPKQIKGADA
jgi:hypothetical protein